MTTETVNNATEIVAIPKADNQPWEYIDPENGLATATIEELEATGRYQAVFLHYVAPGIAKLRARRAH